MNFNHKMSRRLKGIRKSNETRLREKFVESRPIEKGVITAVNGSTCASKPRHVYVTNMNGITRPVFNRTVMNPPPNGLVVDLGYQNEKANRLEVLGINADHPFIDRPDWDGELYDGLNSPHSDSHIIKEGYIGDDPLPIFGRAINILRTWPVGGMSVSVSGVQSYHYDNRRKSFPGVTLDLSSYQPATGYKRSLIIYLDRRANSVEVLPSLEVPNLSSVPFIFPATPPHARISSYITIQDGQTTISQYHIFEGRDFLDGSNGFVAASDDDPYPNALEYKVDIEGYGKSVVNEGGRKVLKFTPPADGVGDLTRDDILELLFMGVEVLNLSIMVNDAGVVSLVNGILGKEVRVVSAFVSAFSPTVAYFVNSSDNSKITEEYNLPIMQFHMPMWYPDAPHFKAKTSSGLSIFNETENSGLRVDLAYCYFDSGGTL